VLRLDQLDEGTRTRILRVVAGLSQHDLASLAGVDRRRLSEHERGERQLRPAEQDRVREALNHALPQGADGVSRAVA